MPQPIDQITEEVWDYLVELYRVGWRSRGPALVPQMKDRKGGRVIPSGIG